MRKTFGLAMTFVLFLATASPGLAQTASGCTTRVLVVDQSGAVLPNAQIQVNGRPGYTQPDRSGSAIIAACAGGKISVAAEGFRYQDPTLENSLPADAEVTVTMAVDSRNVRTDRIHDNFADNMQLASLPMIASVAYPAVVRLPLIHAGFRVLPAPIPATPSVGATLALIGLTTQSVITGDTLTAMPHKTVTVENGHTHTSETYSGVPLIIILAQVGAPTGKDVHGKPLSEYIVATGADGYKAVLALAEAEPDFHPGDVLVADQLGGKPLDAKEGPFKLIVTEDKHPARSVHNLVKLELKQAE